MLQLRRALTAMISTGSLDTVSQGVIDLEGRSIFKVNWGFIDTHWRREDIWDRFLFFWFKATSTLLKLTTMSPARSSKSLQIWLILQHWWSTFVDRNPKTRTWWWGWRWRECLTYHLIPPLPKQSAQTPLYQTEVQWKKKIGRIVH